MIPEPQLKVVQTPYGRTVVKIIPAPNVINLRKRGSLIATRWLASSPYAKYQEIMDEMNREYLRKLGEYVRQMQRWKMEMENYTTSQIKQMKQRYDEMLRKQLRTMASSYSDLLYAKLINSGIDPNKAKEIVLDFLTRSYVPIAQATDILNNLEKRYKPKITQISQPPTPSYSGGGGGGSRRRKTSTSSGSTYTPTTSTPTDISSKIEKVNEAAEKASKTNYKEISTNVSGVYAIVDKNGNIIGYDDTNRGICTITPPSYAQYTCPAFYNPYG